MSEELGTRFLHFERRGPIGWVRIDRPEARNALTQAMYAGIGRAVEIATDDPELRALVITGTGDVFAPGGDLGHRNDEPVAMRDPSTRTFRLVQNSPVPIVAAINGICQAGGLLLALLSDVAVASDHATFRIPELIRGFAEMWYAAILPAHVGVARARELMLTARRFDAHEAQAMGLIGRVVEHDHLEQKAEALAYDMLAAAPKARSRVKQAINARYGVVDEVAFAEAQSSDETREGFAAFMEKRRPAWAPDGAGSEGVLPNRP